MNIHAEKDGADTGENNWERKMSIHKPGIVYMGLLAGLETTAVGMGTAGVSVHLKRIEAPDLVLKWTKNNFNYVHFFHLKSNNAIKRHPLVPLFP